MPALFVATLGVATVFYLFPQSESKTLEFDKATVSLEFPTILGSEETGEIEVCVKPEGENPPHNVQVVLDSDTIKYKNAGENGNPLVFRNLQTEQCKNIGYTAPSKIGHNYHLVTAIQVEIDGEEKEASDFKARANLVSFRNFNAVFGALQYAVQCLGIVIGLGAAWKHWRK